MSRSYYVPGEQRAAKVNELFAGIARRYDLLNDLQSFRLHRRWKGRLIGLARPRPGLRALDVCCGTGDLALALARCGAETVGVDFSEAMLEVAAAKSGGAEDGGRRAGSGVAQFVRGDAQRLPFGDDSFDIVTVGYGLRNLADWEAGLAVLDFGKPDNLLWRGLYFGYLRLFVPLLGRVFGGSASAYAYIHQSLARYPAQQVLAARMRQLGLGKVGVLNLLGGVMAIHCAEKQ
jgi:demethylmenaquinone methyltransferase/2-methoxy-6-polyprenyl-1,4-benzoquinol methylase